MIKLTTIKLVYYKCQKNKITVVIKNRMWEIHNLKYIGFIHKRREYE